MKKLWRTLTITKKMTLFYSTIFSFALFLLSAGVLYSVEIYQVVASHNDIEIVKNAMLTKPFREAEIKESMRLSAKKNIYLRLFKNGEMLFQSEGFNYSFLENIAVGKVVSNDEDEEHTLGEKIILKNKDAIYEIYIVKNLYSEKQFLKILFLIIVCIDVIGMIMSVILGYMFAKRVLKPIGIITKTARSINANNLSARIPLPESTDELYVLSKIFNDMADGLELSFKTQAQFVADASHELKTPIAAIKGHINLLNRWGIDDKSALESSIEAIQKETDYMSMLLSKLLFLAKLDAGRAVVLKEFNLSEMLMELADELKIYHEHHIVECDCDESVLVVSDEAMVKQLIRIITENAFKFTPYHGSVTIVCNKVNNDIVVLVKDTGSGMTLETMECIFDRFYTESQSRNKENSGNGLGLAIAKGICKMLKISIEVQSEVNKGSVFKLVFH